MRKAMARRASGREATIARWRPGSDGELALMGLDTARSTRRRLSSSSLSSSNRRTGGHLLLLWRTPGLSRRRLVLSLLLRCRRLLVRLLRTNRSHSSA